VIQTFLTTFLVDSGYKTPIQNMDKLFASDIKRGYSADDSSILEFVEETDASNVEEKKLICPSFNICLDQAKNYKNLSFLILDSLAEFHYAVGNFIGENSEPFLCPLEDGVMYSTGLTMVMFLGDPLLKRVNEIIFRVVEAGLYNFWISQRLHLFKIYYKKEKIVQQLDEYYSFNLYHMQPAFYLLLMGWCLSALCFIFEVLYNQLFNKRK
jgi:hypothetical protein